MFLFPVQQVHQAKSSSLKINESELELSHNHPSPLLQLSAAPCWLLLSLHLSQHSTEAEEQEEQEENGEEIHTNTHQQLLGWL